MRGWIVDVVVGWIGGAILFGAAAELVLILLNGDTNKGTETTVGMIGIVVGICFMRWLRASRSGREALSSN